MKKKIVFCLIAAVIGLHTDAQLRRPGLFRPGALRRPINLLEPLIPIDEAMNLVKEGKGKGFYQIAIRYASGNELPEDKNAAYKMLCKACDLNYANAILVEGMLDEGNLRESDTYSTAPSTYMYCGAAFSGGRREYAWLTNEVAFARVMKKYEKARDLGALAATNQIAALNKRLADFKREEQDRIAKVKAAEENDRRLAAILGEDMRQWTVDQKQKEQERRERELAAEERKAQLAQLAQIQEELRRQREEKLREREEDRKVELAKYQVALKELIGYEMGQKVEADLGSGSKTVKLGKPYRYFSTCTLRFADGCLWSIELRFHSNGNYTYKSLEAEAEGIRKDLARRFGIVFKDHSIEKCGWNFNVSFTTEGKGIICFNIADYGLQKELRARLKEKGEAQKKDLPAFDEISSDSADMYRKSSQDAVTK